MSDWKQKIEAQIEDLREEAIGYADGMAFGQHLDDTADTMQALLDVAVAVEWFSIHTPSTHIPGLIERARYKEMTNALDKLREVGDG